MPDRVALLREKMAELTIDALVISNLTNLRYLTGFSGSNAVGVLTQTAFFLVTDRRYRDQAQLEVTNAEIHICEKKLFQPIQSERMLAGCGRIAFESLHLPFRSFSHLREIAPDARFVATENLIEKITTIKLPEEIEKIREACRLADAVWEAFVPKIRAGATELELAAELYYLTYRAGAEAHAFEPIVASGWRAALPHAHASRKKLESGELLVVDFGCAVGGFKSDITRTAVLGEPGAEQRKMYAAVKAAADIAFAAATSGMQAEDLDRMAREHLAASGYASAFSHSLGHGLGLAVHELPRIGQSSKDTLPAGCVFTIEPGVYIPELGGVRIEDDVLLSETGPERLTSSNRELHVIG